MQRDESLSSAIKAHVCPTYRPILIMSTTDVSMLQASQHATISEYPHHARTSKSEVATYRIKTARHVSSSPLNLRQDRRNRRSYASRQTLSPHRPYSSVSMIHRGLARTSRSTNDLPPSSGVYSRRVGSRASSAGYGSVELRIDRMVDGIGERVVRQSDRNVGWSERNRS